MELPPTKPPPTLGGLPLKKVAFLGAAALVVVVGIGLRMAHQSGAPSEAEKAPLTVDAPKTAAPPEETAAPEIVPVPSLETTAEPQPSPEPAPAAETLPAAEDAAPPSEAAEQPLEQADQTPPGGDAGAGQADVPRPGDGMILVARKPVELLAEPSATATVMFGFPAGRPFRVIGHEGGFAHIKDLKSGTTGWIDEAALAPPPPLAASPPPRAAPSAGGQAPSTASAPKPKAAETPMAEETPPPAETRKRPGLFGGDGLFGGIFGKRN